MLGYSWVQATISQKLSTPLPAGTYPNPAIARRRQLDRHNKKDIENSIHSFNIGGKAQVP